MPESLRGDLHAAVRVAWGHLQGPVPERGPLRSPPWRHVHLAGKPWTFDVMTRIPASNVWFVRPKPNPRARLRLFCFPYAGGGSVIYRSWIEHLPEAIELWCLRLPGRESRLAEPPFTRLMPLVTALAEVILPYLDVPFAFFGHSMGGLISFELIHAIGRRHDLVPIHAFVSGHRAPHLPDRNLPIHRLPAAELVGHLRRLNGTPEMVLENMELMQLLLPIIRADFAVCETYGYTAREPLPCPISVFGGLQDPRVSYEELAAWRDQTCSAFSHRMFPGGHFFLHGAQALLLWALCRDLAAYLGDA